MKSIHHFREDWLLWRTFSIGKWRVKLFIISEKIGYSVEHFRSGNEEYSSFQRRLVTLENVFNQEMKSECIHHFREYWLLWRTFSIRKWRVFIISEKIGYSGKRFRLGNEEWMYSNILCDLLNDYEFQDKKNSSRSGKLKAGWVKSECFQTYYVTCWRPVF